MRGIYNLRVFVIDRNNNPNFLNELLRYPNRISYLLAKDIEIYGIDENINKNAVANVVDIEFATTSL